MRVILLGFCRAVATRQNSLHLCGCVRRLSSMTPFDADVLVVVQAMFGNFSGVIPELAEIEFGAF
jgi:hypothetical protein